MLAVIQRPGDALALPDQRIADHVLMVILHSVRAEEDIALFLYLTAFSQIQDRAQAVVEEGLLGLRLKLVQSIRPE